MNTAAPATTAGATLARRPTPTDFKPLQELTVGQLLEDPRVFKAMAESAPQHLSPQRLLRVMAQALRKTPKLGLCNPLSLLGAMISCASLGLEPNTPLGHVYLIPFAKRTKNPQTGRWGDDGYDINLIIGYQGLIDLARRSGSLVSIHADVVYEGDEFDYHYGTDMRLFHRPNGMDREGRKATHAYAIAKLEDGEAFEVLAYAEVLRIRDNTQGYKKAMEGKVSGEKNWASAPWVAYEHEMACKTMVRRLSKWLPKSIEFATAVQMDSLAERGVIDFQAIANQPMLAQDPDSVTIDQETGEITDAKTETPKVTATTRPEPPKPPAPKAKAAAASNVWCTQCGEHYAVEPAEKCGKCGNTGFQTKPKQPTPAELAAAAEAAARAAAEHEAAEREADRLQREQAGEQVTAEEEKEEEQPDDDGWDTYKGKMIVELEAQKTAKDAQATIATFRDAVVGAVTRNEITEARGDVLLLAWNAAAATKMSVLQPTKRK